MKKNEIENWALQIIDRVIKKQPVEDDRIELKSTWIDPVKAARRIAGHANAAHGEAILWLIGVDEKEGVKGVNYKDYAEWFSRVNSQFDEQISPEGTCINVPYEGLTVAAILFETDRAPYVVKNPSGTAIHFEVPWRSNTSTKTANRSQLLQILMPSQNIPKIDVLSGELTIQEDIHEKDWHWYIKLYLYVSSNIKTPIVIPFHQCKVLLEIEEVPIQIELKNIKLSPPPLNSGRWHYRVMGTPDSTPSQRPEHDSINIDGTSSEIMIKGAGKFELSGTAKTKSIDSTFLTRPIKVKAKLQPVDTDRLIHLEFYVSWIEADRSGSNQKGSWSI